MKKLNLIEYIKASFPYIMLHTYEAQRAIEDFSSKLLDFQDNDETLMKRTTIPFEWRPSKGYNIINASAEEGAENHPMLVSLKQSGEGVFILSNFLNWFVQQKQAFEASNNNETKLKFVLFVHLESFESISEFLETNYTDEMIEFEDTPQTKPLIIDDMLSEKARVTPTGSVVFIHPYDDFPKTMGHEVAKINFELPKQSERLEKIRHEKASLRDEGKNFPDSDEDIITAENMGGLTEFESENLLYLSISKEKEVYKFNSDVVNEFRVSAINNVPGLTIFRPDDEADIGGHKACFDWFKNVWTKENLTNKRVAPKGFIAVGPTGTGKTAVAKQIGKIAGCPILAVSPADVHGRYVGQSAEQAENMFEVIRAISPCVVFIDEIDKAFGGQETHETSRQVFGKFLTFINDAPAGTFFLATANDMTGIIRSNPEFIRAGRWDKMFFFDLPNEQIRNDIFAIYIDYFSLEEWQWENPPLSTDWTGAEIRQCCKEAAQSNKTLLEAAKFIIPTSQTANDVLEKSRGWASGKCLSSDTGETYNPSDNTDLNLADRKPIKKGRDI
tara:strand:- start:11618 stop:13291 length:1674 start_codon:yes stop_codon:yes gene_type:complete